jgi:15-cis-phytoene synthase
VTSDSFHAGSSLSADQQLCLAYAGRALAAQLRALFVIDQYLGRIALNARESMMARIKLAWWREEGFVRGAGDLAREVEIVHAASSRAQPLLEQIALGWDAFLCVGEDEPEALASYGRGRGGGLFELGAALSGSKVASETAKVGEAWALIDAGFRCAVPLNAVCLEEGRARFEALDRSALTLLPLPLGILATLARADGVRGADGAWRAGSPIRMMRAAWFAMSRR